LAHQSIGSMSDCARYDERTNIPPSWRETVGMTIERDAVRRPHNRALAYLSELAAPALRAFARSYVPARAKPPAEWRQLVILGASHIGDVLFRTPSLPILRRALPNCRIVYVCSPQTAQLLRTNPNVDEVLPLVVEGERWQQHRTTLEALRDRACDAALCTDHIAYHADLVLALRARIPARVGFVLKGFSGLVTHPVRANYPRPYAAYTRSMIAAVTGERESWALRPQVWPTPGDEREALAAWRELDLDERRPVVACTLTVRQRGTAVWPAERFVETLALVARRTPIQVVLCGSAADAQYLGQAASAAPRGVDCRVLAGRLDLLAFASFLSRCDCLLATDSGPRHLANAVGTPVVFVRSLTASQIEAGASCETEADVAPNGEFLSFPAQERVLATLLPADVALVVGRSLASRRGAATSLA
jgi:ADP-heptose:LPS heptosyltransferase